MSRAPSITLHVDGREVELSNPDKLMFPDPGLTKRDVAGHYERVAESMLPHVRDRPVSMRRYPDGVEAPGFVHKEAPGHFPCWIARVEAPKQDGSVTHAVIREPAGLVYLAGQACITPHVWTSRRDRLERPDRMVFDIDPPGEERFAAVRSVARRLGELLRELGLAAFAMTTGSSGLHVVVPLERRSGFEAVRGFAADLAELMIGEDPELLTTERLKERRGGRILLDVMRNGYAQTSVPPYALRARPGAPVATPLEWEELSDSRLAARRWHAGNIGRRLARKGNPWSGIGARARPLGAARRKLDALL